MTNKALLAITAALLSAVPVAISAQSAYHRTPASNHPVSGDVARQGSGKNLTLQQFEKHHERKMLALDTNGDGRISRAEFLAGAKSGKKDPAARFAKIDRNGDGFIDKSEMDARLAKRFQRLDTNGDGVLSVQERAAGQHHGTERDAATPPAGSGAAS